MSITFGHAEKSDRAALAELIRLRPLLISYLTPTFGW